MSQLLKDIEEYWTNRAAGYSEYNRGELAGGQRERWSGELLAHLPDGTRGEIRVLDAGTGPGFFAILLAEAGYQVTAVDYTQEMLREAQKNAGALRERIQWMQMDVQALDFPDGTFDAIVTRNVTWNLEHPEKAYQEWYRVLKYGGILMNSDANWYAYLYDETLRKAYYADRQSTRDHEVEDLYEGTDIEEMERIAGLVPLTDKKRPMWDLQVMQRIGFGEYWADEAAGERILSEMEKINGQSTPVFMVYGKK